VTTVLPRRSRASCALAALALVAAAPRGARGDEPPPVEVAPAPPDKATCLRAFDEGQRQQNRGKLLAARAELITCGQPACPGIVQSQCVAWLRELSASVPSIVVLAKDAAGHDAVDVRVLVDGERVAEALDGRPLSLDPGPHALRFERDGSPAVELSIVAVEGQRNREIQVRFASSAPPAPRAAPAPAPRPAPTPPLRSSPDPSRHATPAVYAGAGVGALGIATGTVTGLLALAAGDALEGECPSGVCAPDQESELERGTALAHVSTASFALGAAGLAVAVVAYVLSGDEAPAGPAGVALRVRPAGLEARF
jgi:hypothetical protein